MSDPDNPVLIEVKLTPEQLSEAVSALLDFNQHLEETEQQEGRIELINSIVAQLQS
jgi:hypothetical protein